ncbi:hypothetical protein KIL84_018269, partial [Mauremys mutica]
PLLWTQDVVAGLPCQDRFADPITLVLRSSLWHPRRQSVDFPVLLLLFPALRSLYNHLLGLRAYRCSLAIPALNRSRLFWPGKPAGSRPSPARRWRTTPWLQRRTPAPSMRSSSRSCCPWSTPWCLWWGSL